MTKQKQRALRDALVRRWRTLLESEFDTNGFWEEVTLVLGPDPTPSDEAAVSKIVNTAKAWIERMP